MLWTHWVILVGALVLVFWFEEEQRKDWKKRNPGATDEDYWERYFRNKTSAQ
jgi:hypothetical protein